eukprot:gene16101-17722_t
MNIMMRFRLLRRLVVFSIYMFSGGLVFMYLESEYAKQALSPGWEMTKLKQSLATRLNATISSIDDMFKKLEEALVDAGVAEPYKWDYYESCFFVASMLTTIGYGHVNPRTIGGQAFAIVYSLIGIPLTLLVIRDFSAKITNVVSKIASKIINHTRKTENVDDKEAVPVARQRRRNSFRRVSESITRFIDYNWTVKILSISLLGCFVVTFLLVSAVVRMELENWTLHEALYFWYITLTTVGFGDYVPFGGRKPDNKFIAVIYYVVVYYVLFGLALVASLIQCISVLLQGRLPTIAPDASEGSIREPTPVKRHCFESALSIQEVTARHFSVCEELLDDDLATIRSAPYSVSPTINLCIRAASCGGALNGIVMTQDDMNAASQSNHLTVDFLTNHQSTRQSGRLPAIRVNGKRIDTGSKIQLSSKEDSDRDSDVESALDKTDRTLIHHSSTKLQQNVLTGFHTQIQYKAPIISTYRSAKSSTSIIELPKESSPLPRELSDVSSVRQQQSLEDEQLDALEELQSTNINDMSIADCFDDQLRDEINKRLDVYLKDLANWKDLAAVFRIRSQDEIKRIFQTKLPTLSLIDLLGQLKVSLGEFKNACCKIERFDIVELLDKNIIAKGAPA